MNRAQRALDCVQIRPHDAVAWSRQLLDDPTADDIERVSARWAMGRALSELGRLDEARAELALGIGLAEATGMTELAAEVRVSLATSLLIAGDTAEAQHQLHRAEPHLTSDASRGRLIMQQGFTELHLGALSAAIDHFDEAEGLLRGSDELARARLLVNRALAHSLVGRNGMAEIDALAARELADELGQKMLAAGATQNLGFAAGNRGAIPEALRWFADARARYDELGSPKRVVLALEVDQCGVLLNGGLFAEAVATARRATQLAVATGNRQAEAEARLLLARAEIANGELGAGADQAATATGIFRESQRPPYEAQARYLELLALSRSSAPAPDLVARAADIAAQLTASGWRREAHEVLTFAGRTALSLGLRAEAQTHLEQVAAAAGEGSHGMRATALLARASLHLADGQREAAKADLSAGLALVEQHRASLGSTELRAHLSTNATELAQLGLSLAFDDGDPVEALTWAERWHAGALQVPPVRPETDSPLAQALDELRQLHVSVMSGTADPVDDVDPDRRIAQLERRIRDLSRTMGAGTSGAPAPVIGPDVAGFLQLLGDRALVEYVTVGETLQAVVAHRGIITLHTLGPMAVITDRVRRVVTTLGRLSYGRGSAASLEASRRALAAMAADLDERLVAKLGLPREAELVVVPTGALQGMPWPALPSLEARAITVTPSGCMWARPGLHPPVDAEPPGEGRDLAAGDHNDPIGPLLVCGPGLPDGAGEIERVGALYQRATVLVGADATVAAVIGAMARAETVHLAAHGQLRADNPMFSALGLHDGPLTVYDLESLRRAPTTVILPACDAGRSSVRHGDELLGTAAALLQVGVRTVVAPLTVVPTSGVVTTLMVELHRAIGDGLAPAQALVRARRELTASHDDVEVATADAFVVIGTC